MSSDVKFIVTPKIGRERPRARQTTVALQRSGWNDYGYQTTFDVFVSVNGRQFLNVGDWKILDLGASLPGRPAAETRLPVRFSTLSTSFVSVAQDAGNYAKLAAHGVALARYVLAALRDAAFVEPEADPRTVDGFETSLLRFPPAREAYVRGRAILAELGILESTPERAPDAPLMFDFSCRLPGAEGEWTHRIDVAFSRGQLDLHRMWALVGDNGAGKTLLLAALARRLSGLEAADSSVTPEPTFKKIIAVSYSPWDTFARPSGEGHRIPYIYCGLRARGDEGENGLLDVTSARKLAAADAQVLRDRGESTQWRQALRACDLARPGTPLAAALQGGDFADGLRRSSAGEQLAAIVITRLVRHVERDALVLFDEPELHMHPALLSALLRTVHRLLVERDAFAIIGTHSPIPLQEIPAGCVRVLDIIDAVVHTRGLDEQCFGATLGDIMASAFRARQDHRNWALFMRELVLRQRATRDEIVAALDSRPGLGLEMLLATLAPDDEGAAR